MKATLTLDTRLFDRTVRAVSVATKRAASDVLNRALKNVAFRAASFTPRRSADEIKAELMANQYALRIVTARLKRKGGKFTRKQIAQAARDLINRRRRGSGADRAGWIPAVRAFGGSFRGARLRTGSMADAGSFGARATPSRLAASMGNAYFGQSTGKNMGGNMAAMQQALQRAILHVANENLNYAKRKIEQTLRRYSA